MGLKPRYPYVVDMAHAQSHRMHILANNGVGYMGSFRNGRIDSSVWFGMVGTPVVGQGFLYGQLNKKGKLTGDDIAYIYPDYLTALVGKFEDTIMKSGRESKIVQVSISTTYSFDDCAQKLDQLTNMKTFLCLINSLAFGYSPFKIGC